MMQPALRLQSLMQYDTTTDFWLKTRLFQQQ